MRLVLLGLLVFGLSFALDLLYVAYVQAVTARRSLVAGAWSPLWHGLNLLNLLALFFTSRWLFVPLLLGGFCGTTYAVWRDPVGRAS